MLSVKQRDIKYDSTWDWTQVSRAIGEKFKHYANDQIIIIKL